MIWTIMITLFAISKTKLLILTKSTGIFHNYCRSRTSNTFLANPQCETRLNMIPLESSIDGQGWRLDGCLVYREDPFKLLSFLCSNVFFCKWSLFFCPFLFLTMHWKAHLAVFRPPDGVLMPREANSPVKWRGTIKLTTFDFRSYFALLFVSPNRFNSLFRKVLPSKFIA